MDRNFSRGKKKRPNNGKKNFLFFKIERGEKRKSTKILKKKNARKNLNFYNKKKKSKRGEKKIWYVIALVFYLKIIFVWYFGIFLFFSFLLFFRFFFLEKTKNLLHATKFYYAILFFPRFPPSTFFFFCSILSVCFLNVFS